MKTETQSTNKLGPISQNKENTNFSLYSPDLDRRDLLRQLRIVEKVHSKNELSDTEFEEIVSTIASLYIMETMNKSINTYLVRYLRKSLNSFDHQLNRIQNFL